MLETRPTSIPAGHRFDAVSTFEIRDILRSQAKLSAYSLRTSTVLHFHPPPIRKRFGYFSPLVLQFCPNLHLNSSSLHRYHRVHGPITMTWLHSAIHHKQAFECAAKSGNHIVLLDYATNDNAAPRDVLHLAQSRTFAQQLSRQ